MNCSFSSSCLLLAKKPHLFSFKSSSSFCSNIRVSSHDGVLRRDLVSKGIASAVLSSSSMAAEQVQEQVYHFTQNQVELIHDEPAKLKALWVELINSSHKPDIGLISAFIDTYAKIGEVNEIHRIIKESSSRGFVSKLEIYFLAISCLGKVGNLPMMNTIIKTMISRGLKINSLIGNAYLKYHAIYGSLEEMEVAYHRVKKLRILIEEEAIREVSHAYIKENKLYKLGEFLRDLGLRRRTVGNLLWNLLLLSFAINFKMKSLQREFINMVDAGFKPDLTTFNIRALAFSRMHMFWDIHLSIKHMKHLGVVPDLVTYGCIVDLYMDKKLGKNLSFALDEFDINTLPIVRTDQLVFEGFGKGDFHSTAEILLESTKGVDWTYAKLVRMYIKKKFRINQVFWNY